MQRGRSKKTTGGPLLLFAVVFGFGVEAVRGPVLEGHVLQFALTAGITDRAVQRVVAEQQLQRGLAGLRDLGCFRLHDHAFGNRRGAGSLQLGHFLDADDTHAAGSLQRKARVVAERGDLDAGGLAGVDEQGARRGGELLAVYGEGNVGHA